MFAVAYMALPLGIGEKDTTVNDVRVKEKLVVIGDGLGSAIKVTLCMVNIT